MIINNSQSDTLIFLFVNLESPWGSGGMPHWKKIEKWAHNSAFFCHKNMKLLFVNSGSGCIRLPGYIPGYPDH